MKRLLGAVLLVAALSACARSDSERTDIITVDGVRCAVVRDGMGRANFLDCDWSSEP